MKYTPTVEAIQINRTSLDEIKKFVRYFGFSYSIPRTPKGKMTIFIDGIRATEGDYIIKKDDGLFYTCTKETFESHYK